MMKVMWWACAAIVPMIAAAWLPASESPLFRQLALALWGIGTIVIGERALDGGTVGTAVRFVGLARCRPAAVVAALVATIPMWLFLPVVAALTGGAISIRPDWPAIIVGVVLVNGLAEEIIHRGFVFHHLRRRYSFSPAAALASALFAAQHLYLIATIGWMAGMAAVVLALLVAFPFAHAFESGGRSIVAPAILHTGSNAPMLVFTSGGGAQSSLLIPYMGIVLLSLYSVIFMGTHFTGVESNDHGRAQSTAGT